MIPEKKQTNEDPNSENEIIDLQNAEYKGINKNQPIDLKYILGYLN